MNGAGFSWKERVALIVGVSVVVIWSLSPFLWQVLTSFKPPDDIFTTPVVYWPGHWSVESYWKIFQARPFGRYLMNSVVVSAGATLLCCLLGSLAAYALARRDVPGGAVTLKAMLLASIFPSAALVGPLYGWYQHFGLLNTRFGLMLAYAALNLPFAIWVLTVFFRQIPREIEEAAWVDGFRGLTLLRKVIVPTIAPAVFTVGILVFIASWNEFLLSLTLVSGDSLRTVPVGIAMLSGASAYEIPWDQISAAAVLTTLPAVLLVAVFQRRIVEGLTAGAVKG